MTPRRKPTPTPPSGGLRGSERAKSGDPIERATVTLPASLIRRLDAIVYERKSRQRAYNRSALIQEAINAYLDKNAADVLKEINKP